MDIKSFFLGKKEIKPVTNDSEKAFADVFFFDEYGADDNTRDSYYVREIATGWTFDAMNAIAEDVMAADLRLYRRRKDGGVDEIISHPALDLLKKPNSEQTNWQLWWLSSMYLSSVGETLWIFDAPSNPKELVCVSTVDMDIAIDKTTGSIREYIDRRTKDNQKPTKFPAERVLFMKVPSLYAPLRGKGVAKYIARTIEIDNNTEEYLKAFFKNDARPAGFLVPKRDEGVGKEAMKRMRAKLEGAFKGVKNKHKLGMLPIPFEWISTGQNMQEMEMNATEERVRRKVLASFKVPESILGIMDKVSANNDVGERIFARRAIKPRLMIFQDYLNHNYLPMFSNSQELEFRFENPVKEDEKMQAEIHKTYVDAGVLTVNEVRETLGYEPLPEPEMPEEEMDENGKPKEPKNPKEGKEDMEDDAMGKAIKKYLETEAKEQQEKLAVPTIEKAHELKINFSNTLEGKIVDLMSAYFHSFEERYLKKIKDTKSIKEISEPVIDEEKEEKLITRIMQGAVLAAILKQSRIIYLFTKGKDQTLPANDEEMKKWLAERMKKSSQSIVNTTIVKLGKVFDEWKPEDGIDQLKMSVSAVFEKRRGAVPMIARSEVSAGAGYATNRVYKEVGAVGKKWRTSEDEKVCEFCGSMDNVIIPIDKNFFNENETFTGAKGGKLDFSFSAVPAFPLHNHCRCDLEPIYKEEEIPESYDYYKSLSTVRETAEMQKKEIAEEKEAIAKEKEALETKKKEIEEEAKALSVLVQENKNKEEGKQNE